MKYRNTCLMLTYTITCHMLKYTNTCFMLTYTNTCLMLTYTSTCLILTGYIEKELKKDELKIPDSDANPKAPAPKEMVDLEVNS